MRPMPNNPLPGVNRTKTPPETTPTVPQGDSMSRPLSKTLVCAVFGLAVVASAAVPAPPLPDFNYETYIR